MLKRKAHQFDQLVEISDMLARVVKREVQHLHQFVNSRTVNHFCTAFEKKQPLLSGAIYPFAEW
jgi:hypothetical protein